MNTPHESAAPSVRPSSSPTTTPSVGDTISERYRLDSEEGRTEAGVVFDAFDLSLDRRVAVEIASSLEEPSARRTWSRDAMLAQRLVGKHVLRILEVGTVGEGVPYVVREAGLCTMTSELTAKGALPLNLAVAWTLEACEAIAEAHSLGMAHGDLRLDNVYLVQGTPEPQVKVSWTSAAKAEGAAKGDVARDIASLAVMLRLLVTGQTESDAEGAATMPSGISQAVARALAQDREGRFENVAQLARILAPFAPPGHGSARAVVFMLSRAGVVGGPLPAMPRAPKKPVPAAPPSDGDLGAVTTSPGDRLSFTDQWFGRPVQVPLVPLVALEPPPRRNRGFAFAVVSVALVSAALGGSFFLWQTGVLPRWTGSAPPDDIGTTGVTSGAMDENERAAENAEANAVRAAEEAAETDKARAEPAATADEAKPADAIRSLPVGSLPEAPAPTTVATAIAPPATTLPTLPVVPDPIVNTVPEVRGITTASPATTAPAADATNTPSAVAPPTTATAPAADPTAPAAPASPTPAAQPDPNPGY